MDESPTSNRGSGLAFWYVRALLALSVYIGAYWLLMDRHPLEPTMLAIGRMRVHQAPHYLKNSSLDSFIGLIFQPLNLVDRKLRPSYWDYDVDLPPTPLLIHRS